MHQHHVAEGMSAPPVVIAPSTSIEAAQLLMRRQQVRRLPVVEAGRLVGIITLGDLRAAQPSAATTLSIHERRALLGKVTVAACMTRNPLTVGPDASLLEAAQLILDHRISGLPVVADGRVVGIITESDLFQLLCAANAGRRVRPGGERPNSDAEPATA